MSLRIEPIGDDGDREWCARLMAANEPWITLGRDYGLCYTGLGNAAKERYVIRDGDARVGLLVLDMAGPFAGYIQSICVVAEARGRGVGAAAIAWAEERIFRDSPNAFICVSSFNPDARRLYERLGYTLVGTLTGFIVDGHDELLLRKRRGAWDSFVAGKLRIEN
jgi:ribosomal-protein-alanine N-acetyltransferase